MVICRDIARGKGHLVFEYDLNSLTLGNGVQFKYLKSHFCTFLHIYYGYSSEKLRRVMLEVRGTLSANLTSTALTLEKITFLHFSPNLLWLFERNLIGTLLRVRGTLSTNLTSNDLDLRKWQSF